MLSIVFAHEGQKRNIFFALVRILCLSFFLRFAFYEFDSIHKVRIQKSQ